MNGEEPVWALLAPLPLKELNQLAEKYRRDVASGDPAFREEDELPPPTWQVVGGTGKYSAIVEYDPGSEGTDERPLAKRISRKVKSPVYVLYLSESFIERDVIDVYKSGRRSGSKPDAPSVLAKELGVNISGDAETDDGEPVRITGVLVVKGKKASDVIRALKMREPLPGPLRVEDGPKGAIVYNDEVGDEPTVDSKISKVFPEVEIFGITISPDEGRLIASVMQNDESKGVFDYPDGADPEEDIVLDSILGAKSPAAIVKALGIPKKILDVSDL
jgi:hypothetical protein